MASHRAVEAPSIRSSSFHTGWIRANNDESPWEVVAHTHNNNDDGNTPANIDDGELVIPCTYLDLATHILMQGTTSSGNQQRLKKYPLSKGANFRWNKDLNFHDNLRIPLSNSSSSLDDNSNEGMLVMLDAMASEGVAVALSPQPGFVKGSTVEIQFGAEGNTTTSILRKQQPPQHPNQTVSVPCRVCKEGTWISLWVAVYHGKVYVGVGSQPGQKCLAFLDLTTEDASVHPTTEGGDGTNDPNNNNDSNAIVEDSTMDASNADTNGGEGMATTTTIIKDTSNGDNLLYVGLGNAAQQRRQIKIRHVHVTTVPSFVVQELETTTESTTMDVLMDQQDGADDEALKAYQEHCQKAKARAQKFGIEYKEPSLAAVVPWSQARKLRANPQKGFITGIDVTDPEELAKQEARKSRFGVASPTSTKKRELEDDSADNNNADETGATAEADTAAGDAMNAHNLQESIPEIQAWDNEELVRFQRVDPPVSLWKIPPEDGETTDVVDEFAMETDKPTLVPEKIHIFSIDWAAFKQIRTDDLMVSEITFLSSGNGLVQINLTFTLFSCATNRRTLQSTDRPMSSGCPI